MDSRDDAGVSEDRPGEAPRVAPLDVLELALRMFYVIRDASETGIRLLEVATGQGRVDETDTQALEERLKEAEPPRPATFMDKKREE